MRRLAAVAGLLFAWACSDQDPGSDGSDQAGDSPGSILASSPLSASGSGPSSQSSSIVYVSAPPGSSPGARYAVLTNARTTAAVSFQVTTGGFDPVRIAAQEGDRITVSWSGSSPEPVLVKKRPPRVVRSSVGPNRTDVPLNAVIEVVFSSPITPESVQDQVRLLRPWGDPVPGIVVVGDDRLVVEFRPETLLAPSSEYVLEIGTGVQDVTGAAVQEPVSVPFTTGTTTVAVPPPPPPAPLTVTLEAAGCCPTGRYRTEGHWLGIEPGTTMVFQVLGRADLGPTILAGTSASGVAEAATWREAGLLTVMGLTPGRTRITASVAGATGEADILVYGPEDIPVDSRYRVAGIDEEGRLATALLDGSRVLLLNDTITDVQSWGAMRNGRLVFSRRSGGVFLREPLGGVTRVVGTQRPARCVTASRDGAWVAWVAAAQDPGAGSPERWNIVVARMDGASTRLLVPGLPTHACPTWTADGRLVYRAAHSELRAIHPDGLNDMPYLTSPEGRILLPAEWSWGLERRMVVEGYSLRVSNPDGSNRVDLHTYGLGARVSWSPDGRYLLAQTVGGVAVGGTYRPMRMLVTADGLRRADLPALSATLQEAGFVPW